MKIPWTVWLLALLVVTGHELRGEDNDAPDPFCSTRKLPLTTEELKKSVKEIKEEFRDVLLPFADDPGGSPDRLAGVPYEERTSYFAHHEAEARKVLAEMKPHCRLPEPMLLPQVIRYINSELSAQHLSFRVRLQLIGVDPPKQLEQSLKRYLYTAMPLEKELSKVIREGSVWDIVSGIASNIRPSACLCCYEDGLIIIAPGVSSG
jgi:hypothetical protein